jgi:Cys-tRNA(Pro)/Cys-tRNA(Cys) deacylase
MTPAILLLNQHGITYVLHEYEHQASTKDYGLEAVAALNLNPNQVFKTLVCELTPIELAVAVVPVSSQLNLKAFAQAAGGKKARLADPKQVEVATGYVLGGISPLAQKKPLRTFIDRASDDHNTIYISAGRRGLEIEIALKDLLVLTRGQLAPIKSARSD